MTSILPTSLLGASSLGLLDQDNKKTYGSGFEALLASLTDTVEQAQEGLAVKPMGLGGDTSMSLFIAQIMGSLENAIGGSNETSAADIFAGIYTPATGGMGSVESIIAGGGPLPSFINELTAQRGLTAKQQEAVWTIARNNWDIVKTPESVAKVAKELEQIGL